MSATMKNHVPRLTGLQFATMITSGYVALGLFYFPREAITAAHRSAPWSILLDGLVTFALMHLLFRMNRLAPHLPLSSLSPLLLGQPIAFVLSLYAMVYHLLLAIAVVVLFSFVLGNIFLPDTPIWAIDAAMVATALYMAWHGTVGLGRTIQAVYIPVALLSMLTFLATVSLIRYPILLLPSSHVAVWPVLIGAERQYATFLGFELTVTLYPEIAPDQRPRAERYTYLGLALVLTMFLIMYEIIISSFGPALTAQLRWPIVSMMRILSVSGFFIDKFGLLVVVLWTILVTSFLSVRLWCLGQDATALLPGKHPTSFRLVLLVGAFIVVVAGIAVPNAKIVDLLVERYLIPFGLAYLIAVPSLVLLAATLRQSTVKRIQTKSSSSP